MLRTARLHAIGLLLFGLAWLNNDHFRPWPSFHAEMLALAALFCMGASALLESAQPFVLPKVSAWIFIVIPVPWLLHAVGAGSFAGDALISSLYLSALLAAVCVGFSFNRPATPAGDDRLTGLMHSLWLAAMLSAAIGLVQWLNLQEALTLFVAQSGLDERAMGNLGQANNLASLLLMGLVAYAWVYEKKVLGPLAFGLGVAFISLALVLTQSRTGMLGVVVLAGFIAWKGRRANSRLSSIALAVWVLGCWIGSLLLPYLGEALLMGEVRSVGAPGSVSARVKIWQQVAHGVGQSPWLGFGWNETPAAHAAGAVAHPGDAVFTHAHNFALDLVAWNGLPLGLILTGLIAYWFVTRMRACTTLAAIYAMACLLPFAVHSMLEFPFAYAHFLIMAGFMVGVIESSMAAANTIRLGVRWAWGFVALWAMIGVLLVPEYFLIEEDFRVVRFQNLRIGRTPETHRPPEVRLLTQLGAMLKASRQVPAPNMSKQDIDNLHQVSDRFAYGSVRFRYTLALALNADPLGAVRQLAIIRGMYGEPFYLGCIEEIKRLQRAQYPQLDLLLQYSQNQAGPKANNLAVLPGGI
jgi:O-antigen ligase